MSSTHTKVATFKERFYELSGESEKTITDLAKELHVSYQTISAWRLGTRSPKEPTIIAIANHFGVDVAWLMGFDVPKNKSTPQQTTSTEEPQSDGVRLLIKGLNKLSPAQLEQATNVMKAMFAEYAEYFNKENTDET